MHIRPDVPDRLKNGHNGGNAYEKNDSFCDGAGIGLYITVKLTSGTACVGGVSYAGTKLKNCYNTGAVSLTGNGLVGGIAVEFYSWKPYQSKAKKVSSITFGNCSKLSSKYWTYSNKHKRLILKNNKEA